MLKCRICGGELQLSSERYTCLNCGADFSLKQIYENVDVCLCNVDSEENGRRTVASHLSAEIYTLLEAHSIKTYYSRVAAVDLFGEALERANISAISSARVIILVGTKPAEFEVLSNKYRQLFENKVVVPVFKEMDARDLPKGVNAVQGVDYSRIGASTDLVRGILNALGRGDEYDYLVVSAKNRKTKNVWLLVCFGVVALVIAAVIATIIFSQKDKRLNENTEQETADITETVLSTEDIYLSAKVLADAGQYADAIIAYSEVTEHKDSQKQINLLYQKYAGYYTNEETNVDLHLKVANTNITNIVLTYHTQDNYVCKIDVAIPLSNTTGSFEFLDSENNSGNASFLLTNYAVQLQIKTTEKTSEIFFPDSKIIFPLTEKKDAPMRTVTIEQLISLVKTKTLVSDLSRRGIEVIARGNDGEPGTLNIYDVVNTDIMLYATISEEPHIYAISVPTSILKGTAYNDIEIITKIDGVFVLPGGIYGAEGLYGEKEADISYVDIFTKTSTNDGEDIAYWEAYSDSDWRGLDWHFFGTEN